jgi:phosphinothricin acetyltransferase
LIENKKGAARETNGWRLSTGFFIFFQRSLFLPNSPKKLSSPPPPAAHLLTPPAFTFNTLTAMPPAAMPDLEIRPTCRADAAAITRIYNISVLQTAATFQTSPDTLPRRLAWLRAHGPRHPAFTALLGGRVVGWGALSPYAAREAWRFTVEDSVYLDASAHGLGHGTRLLRHLLDEARRIGHRVVLARIVAGHEPSLGLHTKLGFTEAGRLLRVGWKLGHWHDVVYMQLDLAAGNDAPPNAPVG